MGRKRDRFLRVMHPHCAGIDIGAKEHFVAVDPQACETPVRRFGCFTDELKAMGRWLNECGVTSVAMESTGVYWIPVYELLERMGLEVHLVDSRASRNISGRKSDVLDCQWLWQLMSYGLLRSAFRPADAVCELRAYVRQHGRIVAERARTVQHMHKALTQMNIQVHTVLSDMTGKTGMRILRAIDAGERDGATLARHRDPRVKASTETLARSLQGNWRDEHLFSLHQALQSYDLHCQQLTECERAIARTTAKLATGEVLDDLDEGSCAKHIGDAVRQLLGVDLTAIPSIGPDTALLIASELGADLSRFEDTAHFCSWLALAPPTRISGGKKLPGRSKQPTANRIGQALLRCAVNARQSKTFIGAAHRSRLRRLDKPRAIKATAHHLARLIYAMLTKGEEYVERGMAAHDEVRQQRDFKALTSRARKHGYALVKTDLQSGAYG